MTGDDDFQARLGKIRAGGRGRSYLSRVLRTAMLASAGRFGRAQGRKAFTGARIGRGAGVASVVRGGDRRAGLRGRRVIVKFSTPSMKGKGLAAARAHLRYVQRDGVSPDGAPGQLYDAREDRADGRAFMDRSQAEGDTRQFRLIVSPEDGAEYGDLKDLTRRLMKQMEKDLATRLDWVAVDHFNTGHPHTHILVRGRDEAGKDLIIAKDYLTMGLRERACELVSLDLGPVTDREIGARLDREVGQERLTGLDRGLLRDVEAEGLVSPRHGDPLQFTARTGRLQTLARLGLAREVSPTRWRLADGLEDTLRRMGERGDIQKTLHRALSESGLARAPAEQAIYDPRAEAARPIVGRLVHRGLLDELRDRHFVVVDGVDGRAHFVDIGRGEATGPIPIGAVVEIAPRQAAAREVDRTVATIAAEHDGRYGQDLHLAHDPTATPAFVEAHVRRLEGLRRGKAGPERLVDGTWSISTDHVDRVAAFEHGRLRDAPVSLVQHAHQGVEHQARAHAPTWLDRQLLSDAPEPLRDAGFGREVRQALAQRRQWLIDEGLAQQQGDQILYRAGLLKRLEAREQAVVGAEIARETGLAYAEARPGERIDGVYRRSLELSGGRMAVIERSRDFTLVPWRPVLDGHEGRAVSGVLRPAGVSWTLGRGRGGPSVS